ncbi:MAG TPA: IS1595 family transposase [Pyrinomonadaceae bacterium]|jgi:transposase-like protein|nr:IS1595 family transposase [Pyrinomonadaceae bacterium]
MENEATLNLANLAKYFSDEDEAREFLEWRRWPNGTICPHCKAEGAYKLTAKEGSKTPVRKGVWKCKACRKQFTVRVGSIFEDSHIPLSKWLLAIHLMCSSKKGMSAHQLHRMMGITYKSAWFLVHRIRYAMSQEPMASKLNGIVESDETYIGGKAKNMHASVRKLKVQGRGVVGKAPVVTLVERDGRVRSTHLATVTQHNLRESMRQCVSTDATICTDESALYFGVKDEFAGHEAVNHHKGEYVRGGSHVNTSESFHALLKRGVHGTYHHWPPHHLHRYLSEFDFRFNWRKVADGERTLEAIKGFEGKRLMYKDSTKKR